MAYLAQSRWACCFLAPQQLRPLRSKCDATMPMTQAAPIVIANSSQTRREQLGQVPAHELVPAPRQWARHVDHLGVLGGGDRPRLGERWQVGHWRTGQDLRQSINPRNELNPCWCPNSAS